MRSRIALVISIAMLVLESAHRAAAMGQSEELSKMKAALIFKPPIEYRGSEADVRILKPSRDDTFDRVAVDTLHKWRLHRGPLNLELPLSFTLTPGSDIPKSH